MHDPAVFPSEDEGENTDPEETIGRQAHDGLEHAKKTRTLHWDVPHVLIIIGVALSYVYQYYQNDFDVFVKLVALTLSVGIVTAVVWRITAKFTVEAFKSVFDLLHGKNDLLCRIRSPESKAESLLDHLFMAVEWSLFPTLVVFFILSFIAQGIAEEGKAVVENNMIFVFMFFIPPLTTFISIPIRLLTDSSLMKFDIQKRILEPFGLSFRRMFRAVGGVGALASFAKVALNKGGIENAVVDTFTILLYIFPTIFIAAVLYGVWHPRYLRAVEKKIERLHYQVYRFERNVLGTILLEPVSDEEEGLPGDTGENLNLWLIKGTRMKKDQDGDADTDTGNDLPDEEDEDEDEEERRSREDDRDEASGEREDDNDLEEEDYDDAEGKVGEDGDDGEGEGEGEVGDGDEDENYDDDEDDENDNDTGEEDDGDEDEDYNNTTGDDNRFFHGTTAGN